MSYFLTSFIYIFFIRSFSIFLKKIFRYNDDLSLVYSIILIAFLTLFLFKIYLIKYAFLIFLFFTFIIIYKNKSQIFYDYSHRFLFYSIVLVIVCYERYFLDEDELTYWGINTKFIFYLFFSTTDFYKDLYEIKYHSVILPAFQSIGFFVTKFREDILILTNNLIILSSFFCLFQSYKKNWFLQLNYFVIFYILLNLFSFGLNSIYADVILVLLSSILFKQLYTNKINIHSLLIIIIIPLIHRIGFLFVFIFMFNFIILNYNLYKQKVKYFIFGFLVLIIIIFLSISYDFRLPFINHHIISYIKILINLISQNNLINLIELFLVFLKEIILFNTPYIAIFSLFNDIISFFNFKYSLPLINIKLYKILLLILLVNFYFYKNKKIFFLNYFNLFFFIFFIYFVKIYTENLHPYSTIRYIMFFGLFYFILIMSLIYDNSNNIKKSLLLLTLLIFVIPSKSIGFFLPQKIYLSDVKNKEYYNFTQNLKKIKKKYNFEKNINNFIYVNNNSLNSLERSRLFFEFYPDIFRGNKKNIFEVDEFNKLINEINQSKTNNSFNGNDNLIIKSNNKNLNIILTQEDLVLTKNKMIIEKLK